VVNKGEGGSSLRKGGVDLHRVGHSDGKRKRDTLLMVLSCLLPLILVAALWAAGFPSFYLIIGILFLCPIFHFIIMSLHSENKEYKQSIHPHQNEER